MRRSTSTKTLTARLLLWGGFSLFAAAQAQSGAPANCALPSGPVPTQSRAVFVLDTSGSMRGIGDGKADIFGRVKDSISRYLDEAQPNQVKLITFNSGVQGERSYELPAQKEQLRDDLGNLRADGNNTYLYRSMHSALSPLSSSDRYVTNVFVLTDGIDNDPKPQYSAEGALSSFESRGTLDTLSYIALGSDIPNDAKNALAASDYASGVTLPVGEVPDLGQLTGGTRLATVTDPRRVPVPFADGTPLSLTSPQGGIRLEQTAAEAGQTQLSVAPEVPAGSVALLCAPPSTRPNVVGPRTRRVLLQLQPSGTVTSPAASDASVTLNAPQQTAQTPQPAPAAQAVPADPASTQPIATTTTTTVQVTTEPTLSNSALSDASLTWLNPGASTRLARGEETVLRYRASGGLNLDGAQLLLPTGLVGLGAQLERQPGAREFAVRVTRAANAAADGVVAPSLPSGLLTPRLLLPSGQVISLAPVQVAGLEAAPGTPTTIGVSPQNQPNAIPAAPAGGASTGQNATGQGAATRTTTTQTTTTPANPNPAASTPVQPSSNGTQTQAGQAQGNQAQTNQAAQPTSANQATQTTQTTTTQTTTQNASDQDARRSGPAFPWWLLLLGLLALLGLGLFALLRRRGGTGSMAAAAVKGNRPPPPAKKVAPAPVPATPAPAPAAAPFGRVEGLHYRDDRTLALVGLGGEVRGMPSPLSGTFDLGQISRAAELRGVQAEQVHEGLRLVQVPDDVQLSYGTKLFSAGDIVMAGTLLSVVPVMVAGTGHPALGTLTGLGRPLMLRANGSHLEITGPYGEHILSLTPGILDLGDMLEAPALRGLRLSTRGYRILLTDVPERLSLAPLGEQQPLKAGMYLPEHTGLLLRGL